MKSNQPKWPMLRSQDQHIYYAWQFIKTDSKKTIVKTGGI